MKSAFDRAMVWTVDHRRVTFALILLTTAFAVIGYLDPSLVRSLFVGAAPRHSNDSYSQSEAFEPLPNVDPVSLSDSDAVVVVQSPAFFTPSAARAMRRVVEKLEDLDHVSSVLWMDRVPILNIFGLPEPLFPRSEASPERFAAAREKAMRHPLVGGQLLSQDGRTLLLLVSFDMDYIRSDEQCTSELREVAESTAAEFPDVDLKFQVTGSMPAWITAMRAHEANQVKYQVIGYGVILLMAVLLFRGVRAVLVVALAPATGVFWTLSQILRFAGEPIQ
jgi:predicted RND superfamily exporter protein